jgi:hypothetical protein
MLPPPYSQSTVSQQFETSDYQRTSQQPRREHKQHEIISAVVVVVYTDQHSCEHQLVSRRFVFLHVTPCHLVATHRHGVTSQETSIFINPAVRNGGSASSIFLPRVEVTEKPVHSSVTVITGVCQFYFSSVADPHGRRVRGKTQRHISRVKPYNMLKGAQCQQCNLLVVRK